ncbi:hypothetical protein LTR98_011962, partial [Exophiala xenobiotica]
GGDKVKDGLVVLVDRSRFFDLVEPTPSAIVLFDVIVIFVAYGDSYQKATESQPDDKKRYRHGAEANCDCLASCDIGSHSDVEEDAKASARDSTVTFPKDWLINCDLPISNRTREETTSMGERIVINFAA